MKRLLLALLLLLPVSAWPCSGTDSYSTTICADSPTKYYRLDDSSGTAAVDQGSDLTNGTYTGGFTLSSTGLVPSNTDKSVTLNGSTGRVDFGSSANGSWGPNATNSSGWSFEAWINETDTGGNTIAGRSDTANTSMQWWLFSNSSGNPFQLYLNQCAGSGSYGIVNSSVNWAQSTTFYVAVTTLGSGSNHLSEANLCINATCVQATSFSGALCQPANSGAELGARYASGSAANAPLTGRIDEAAYYATRLSQAQITAHYNSGTTIDVHRYRPFTSRRDEPRRRLVIPTSLIERHGPSMPVDVPTFVLDRLNARAITVSPLYSE